MEGSITSVTNSRARMSAQEEIDAWVLSNTDKDIRIHYFDDSRIILAMDYEGEHLIEIMYPRGYPDQRVGFGCRELISVETVDAIAPMKFVDNVHKRFYGQRLKVDVAVAYLANTFTRFKNLRNSTVPEPVSAAAPVPLTITVGKTYSDLVIDDSVTDTLKLSSVGVGLRPGSIPTRITRIDFEKCIVSELESGVITDSVTHLFLNKLTQRISIPASVKHLAVLNFEKHMIQYVPATVTHMYIHIKDQQLRPEQVHYLFDRGPNSLDAYVSIEQGPFGITKFCDSKPFQSMWSIYKVTPHVPEQYVHEQLTKTVTETQPPSDPVMTEITDLKAQVADLKTIILDLVQVVQDRS